MLTQNQFVELLELGLSKGPKLINVNRIESCSLELSEVSELAGVRLVLVGRDPLGTVTMLPKHRAVEVFNAIQARLIPQFVPKAA